MYTIAFAYAGSGSNNALRKLLHVAVSDVADDVRRALTLTRTLTLTLTLTLTPTLTLTLTLTQELLDNETKRRDRASAAAKGGIEWNQLEVRARVRARVS